MIKKIFLILFVFSFVNISYAEMYKVKRGDTLVDILSEKMYVTDFNYLNTKIKKVYRPFHLKAGMVMDIQENNATIFIDKEKIKFR